MLVRSNEQVGKAGGDKWKSMSDAVSNYMELGVCLLCAVEIA